MILFRKRAYIDLHLVVEAIVHDETVAHANTVRLHRVSRSVMIVSNVLVIKVGDLLPGFGRELSWDLQGSRSRLLVSKEREKRVRRATLTQHGLVWGIISRYP